jgi:hypothetical protein
LSRRYDKLKLVGHQTDPLPTATVALTNEHRHKKLGLEYLFVVRKSYYGWFGGYLMRLILPLFLLAIIGLGVLTACNSAEWKDARTSPVGPGRGTAPPAPDGARRVTVAELKDLLDKNEAVVIDVRNEASYNTGHIRGAKLIPEAEVVNHVDQLPRNKLIVTYCS